MDDIKKKLTVAVLGSHPPSPADSGVSDVEPSSSSPLSDEETKSRIKSEFKL